MPRMRTIKPGFFGNEELIELDPLACLLFAGLWCWADREGRLEDRPKRLKLEILPGRDCDADDLLDQLAARGFIERYAVGDARYIQVVRFARHQNPHKMERPSAIPAPCQHGASTVQAPEMHPGSRAGHGVWGVGHGSWGAGHGVPPPAEEEKVGGTGGVRGGRAPRATTAAAAAGHPDFAGNGRGDDAPSGTARLAPDLPRAQPEDLTQPRPKRAGPAWTEPIRRLAAQGASGARTARTPAEPNFAAAEAAALGAFDTGQER